MQRQILLSGVTLNEYSDCEFFGITFVGQSEENLAKFLDCKFFLCTFKGLTLDTPCFTRCSLKVCSFIDANLKGGIFALCSFACVDFTGCRGLPGCYFASNCTGLEECQSIGTFRNIDGRGIVVYTISEKTATSPTTPPGHPPPKVTLLVPKEKKPRIVDHYVSPACSIVSIPEEEEEEWENWWFQSRTVVNAGVTDYGYGKTAVLECADIDEFRGANK